MNPRYVPLALGKKINLMFDDTYDGISDMYNFIKEHIYPVSLEEPIDGLVGYIKGRITEGYIIDDLFIVNTPPSIQLFTNFFTIDYEKICYKGFGIYLAEDVGKYGILTNVTIPASYIVKPTPSPNTWYVKILYDESRGYNKYEKGKL